MSEFYMAVFRIADDLRVLRRAWEQEQAPQGGRETASDPAAYRAASSAVGGVEL
jgi:hypothetical protein